MSVPRLSRNRKYPDIANVVMNSSVHLSIPKGLSKNDKPAETNHWGGGDRREKACCARAAKRKRSKRCAVDQKMHEETAQLRCSQRPSRPRAAPAPGPGAMPKRTRVARGRPAQGKRQCEKTRRADPPSNCSTKARARCVHWIREYNVWATRALRRHA